MDAKATAHRDEYIKSCDNESGGFLSHQLERIRRKAWDAGYAYQEERLKIEVEALKIAGDVIHGEFCGSEHHPNCVEVEKALGKLGVKL